ncbi:MAG: glycosyltransferase, partial [Bacteroidales bacterium]
MSTAPPLSLITITYNAQDVLLRTLQSIESQSTQNIEHIIIDGKS